MLVGTSGCTSIIAHPLSLLTVNSHVNPAPCQSQARQAKSECQTADARFSSSLVETILPRPLLRAGAQDCPDNASKRDRRNDRPHSCFLFEMAGPGRAGHHRHLQIDHCPLIVDPSSAFVFPIHLALLAQQTHNNTPHFTRSYNAYTHPTFIRLSNRTTVSHGRGAIPLQPAGEC